MSDGLLLAAALVTDELFPTDIHSSGVESGQLFRDHREQYKQFLNNNSDLLVLSNIFGFFFKDAGLLSMTRFTTMGFLKGRLNQFCQTHKINQKAFSDGIAFLLQVFKICKLIFDVKTNQEIINHLDSFAPLKSRDEQTMLDIIVTNSSEKCAKKVVLFNEQNKAKVVFETLDFQQARLFNTSFISKSSEFYVYKNVFEANGYFNKQNFSGDGHQSQ